jgi:hypothetical protein
MSEHAWTQEQIAGYVIGGLTAEERERAERHIGECSDCAAALAAGRGMDHSLQALFADVRPGLELEDDAVRSTRTVRTRRFTVTNWAPRMAVAAVLLLALGVVGAMSNAVVSDGRLPMPGTALDRRHMIALSAPYADQLAAHTASVSGVIAGKDEAERGYSEMKRYQTGESRPRTEGAQDAPLSKAIDQMQNATRGDSSVIKYGEDFRNKNPAVFYGGQPQPNPGTPGYSVNPEDPNRLFLPSRLFAGATAPDPQQPTAVNEEPGAPARQPPANSASEPEPGARRVIIRSGTMEFEVNSFDEASSIVTKLVAGLNGAFVATVNSEKLPSGKVRGAITVRTPPEQLDRLVIDLRRDLGAAGELKGMKIGSQDITKQYTDLESRLRGARAMEQRLMQLIKDGKGEIKQLLEAEKELGVWRTKIEEIEGEIRFYANQAALSTLTIALAEKEARAATTESERVQAGVEVEDVDKAYQQALSAVAEAKGRVAKSELKQLSAGQFNASLQFEVPPDAAGPLRDRLRQLGHVARLEIDRVQQATGGTPPADAKVKRGDTLFLVQLYNLANVAARETATLQVAVPDVRAAYQALRDVVGKATGRVLNAQFNEQDAQNVTAQLDFEVRRADEGAIRAALDAAGEVLSRQVIRAPESNDSTDTKVLYRVTLLATTRLSPRETTTLTLEVPDVDQALSAFAAQVAEAKGRQLSAQSTRDQSGKVSGRAVFEVPMTAAGIIERFKSAGTVRVQQSARDAQAPAGKYATARFDVTLVNRDQIVAEDDGLWPQVRRGLSYSVAVLLTSVTWVVFGLCVVLPWAVAIYVCYRLFRRFGRPSRPPAIASPAPG